MLQSPVSRSLSLANSSDWLMPGMPWGNRLTQSGNNFSARIICGEESASTGWNRLEWATSHSFQPTFGSVGWGRRTRDRLTPSSCLNSPIWIGNGETRIRFIWICCSAKVTWELGRRQRRPTTFLYNLKRLLFAPFSHLKEFRINLRI